MDAAMLWYTASPTKALSRPWFENLFLYGALPPNLPPP